VGATDGKLGISVIQIPRFHNFTAEVKEKRRDTTSALASAEKFTPSLDTFQVNVAVPLMATGAQGIDVRRRIGAGYRNERPGHGQGRSRREGDMVSNLPRPRR